MDREAGRSGWISRGLVRLLLVTLPLSFTLPVVSDAEAQSRSSTRSTIDTSDAALVKLLPGFQNGYARVNGVRLHYVAGGTGAPLVLLPGHPETWWGFNKIMPALAKKYRVIVVDIRGMGSSDKPAGGYDKKTMAHDIYALVRQLGYKKINIAGHDIGSMVAFSFAANHPEATAKLALLDVPPADESLFAIRMLPREGTFGAKVDATHPIYPWWFAMHQVNGLPEKLLANGGMSLYVDWLFNYLLNDSSKLSARDLAVYKDAYQSRDSIRAGHAWYKAFPRDVNDGKAYKKLEMPVLGLGAEFTGYEWLQAVKTKASDFQLVKVENSGHFIHIEQPEFVARHLIEFFD